LFEGAVDIFSTDPQKQQTEQRRERAHLQEKLKKAQEVITELTVENLELRKNGFGEI
jgi:hypothetical protein